MILITGGAGFIGSALVRHIIRNTDKKVVNIDKLTYAANLDSLESIYKMPNSKNYSFQRVDILSPDDLDEVFKRYNPDSVMHLAAESHVDNSIRNSFEFLQTNIIGTYNLLEKSRIYFDSLCAEKKLNFKFHHISTDEVYGDLDKDDHSFTENTSYSPSSPYSATKASSDHLVRAWSRTYGLPVLITNCSNNYGPYQFPEKLIPRTILNALKGEVLPIYGDGKQIRDWLYVEDHVKALMEVHFQSNINETFNIGGSNELTNIEVVENICELLEIYVPNKPTTVKNFKELISFTTDRLGHDRRYSIDNSKIVKQLDWTPSETFKSGLEKTVKWYIDHQEWLDRILSGEYKQGNRK